MGSSRIGRAHFFTNRQVTTMVVAFMAAVVLLPGAVWAVDSFTNVAIMDPVTGVKARVDSGRKLTVSDGSGLLTVDGTVTARPAAPVDFRTYYGNVRNNGSCIELAVPPAGKAIVIETVNFDVFQNPSPSEIDYIEIDRGRTCSGGIVGVVIPPGLGHTTFPLDPGVVSSAGFSIHVSGDVGTTVTASGYLVPAAGLPA